MTDFRKPDISKFTLENVTKTIKELSEKDNKREMIVYFGYKGKFYNTKDNMDIFLEKTKEENPEAYKKYFK